MSDLPTSLDDLVRDSRRLVTSLRLAYGDTADFNHYIRDALAGFLAGYPPSIVAFTLKAIFGDD